jgi:hypothetical protein
MLHSERFVLHLRRYHCLRPVNHRKWCLAYSTTRGSAESPHNLGQFLNPLSYMRFCLSKILGFKPYKDHAIWAFDLAIALRVWHWGIVDLDARVCTKDLELPRSKLSPIISDNVIGYPKPVHDISDEFYRLCRYDGGGRLNFEPFWEFIHCDEDMCESTFSFLERTNQIWPPCGKRLGNGYGLQLMRWHMFLAGKKLATFTLMYDRVSVRHGGEPKEPLPIRPTHEWFCTCVTPVDSYVYVLQDDLSFLWGYAFH